MGQVQPVHQRRPYGSLSAGTIPASPLSGDEDLGQRKQSHQTSAEAAQLVENYVAAHKGSKSYRYAGVLDRHARGKSDGTGRGVGSDTMPSHNRNTLPLSTESSQPRGISCYNCYREGYESPACPLRKPKQSCLCYVPNPTPSFKTQQNREPTITVKLNGKPVTALLDTGCTQTLVQTDLVPLECKNCEDKLIICSVHGDKSEHSTADVYVEVCGQTYMLLVGLVPKLPYPVLLGQVLLVLPELLNKTTMAKEQNTDMAKLPYYGEDVLAEPTYAREERCEKRRQTVSEIIEHSGMQDESDVSIPNVD